MRKVFYFGFLCATLAPLRLCVKVLLFLPRFQSLETNCDLRRAAMQAPGPNRVKQRLAEQRRVSSPAKPGRPNPLPLNVSEMLIAEFEYASQSAFQAHEDRARVSSYYLVSAGTAVAAILGVQRQDVLPNLSTGFALIFAVLSVVGVLTLLQMIRLRQAWYDSAHAMNCIKEYFTKLHNDPALSKAFAWQRTSLPRRGKAWSVAFLLALTVMLIDACAAGGSIVFFGYSPRGVDVPYRNWAIAVAVFVLGAQIVTYKLLLNEKAGSQEPSKNT
jgi:hypothetical protein